MKGLNWKKTIKKKGNVVWIYSVSSYDRIDKYKNDINMLVKEIEAK